MDPVACISVMNHIGISPPVPSSLQLCIRIATIIPTCYCERSKLIGKDEPHRTNPRMDFQELPLTQPFALDPHCWCSPALCSHPLVGYQPSVRFC